MATEESNSSHEVGDGLTDKDHEAVDWRLFVFLALASTGLLLPHVLVPFVGLYWAAGVSIVAFVIWFKVMPTTCMSGGFVSSIVAMAILFNTIGIILGTVIRFVRN